MRFSIFLVVIRRVARSGVSIALAWSLACAIAWADASDHHRGTIQLSFDLPSVHRYLAGDILTALPAPQLIGVDRLEAFEDHEHFAYIFGTSNRGEPTNAAQFAKPSRLRRIYFIRPNLIVIDDQVDARRTGEVIWTLHAPGLKLPSLDGRGRGRVTHIDTTSAQEVLGANDDVRFLCRMLLPKSASWTTGNDGQASHSVRSKSDDSKATDWLRVLHVVAFAADREPTLPACNLERQEHAVRLELVEQRDAAEPPHVIRLWIPDGPASGRIEIVDRDENMRLANRLLPAGILPPDLDAARRRLQWDLPYQIAGQAIWDTKHASSELRRLVESGQIEPCRTVEIGCGTGNDAIYLASRGFDVTAIDIAPTALNIAQRKAEQAGVRVNWLLADVLHPPRLEPFDFAYDRGCYHEVRQHHAKDYIAALQQLTHHGSKILILAASANKDSYWRFAGPPRVREADIRADFAAGFRLLQLREFRFDPAPPEREGPLAWSILLQREQ